MWLCGVDLELVFSYGCWDSFLVSIFREGGRLHKAGLFFFFFFF